MKDRQVIGTITSTGVTPLFVRIPQRESRFRRLGHGEQCPLYRGAEVCLYRDKKDGIQIYTLHSVSNNSLKRPNPPPVNVTPSQPASTLTEEESRQLALLPADPAIKKLLAICSATSSRIRNALSKTSGTSLPEGLLAQLPHPLHPHQIFGVQWLMTLYQQGQNGILADEMGLGKTVQVLSFLKLISQHNQHRFLIVVPSSLVYNWENEVKEWCKNITYLLYVGSQEEKKSKQEQCYQSPIMIQLFITTYTIFERDTMGDDRNFISQFQYDVLILDEGHCIKNHSSKRYSRLAKLKAKHIILLSGTPVQNNLQELFSLLSFLLPSHSDEFVTICKRFNLNQTNPSIITYTKKILEPFILRRVKHEVLTDLPTKTQEIKKIQMIPAQHSLYEEHIKKYDTQFTRKSSSESNDYDLVSLYIDLRKIANHPLLVRNHYSGQRLTRIATIIYEAHHYEKQATTEDIETDLKSMSDIEIHFLLEEFAESTPSLCRHLLSDSQLTASGKLRYLLSLLPSLLEQGHRVLLFSQWVTILNIISLCLQQRHISFYRIDGKTPPEERQQMVDAFNTSNTTNVFMLTTRSGGLGLNLIGADTVILHDSDFNPNVDRQAEDRCHRIGQTRPVHVIKLISKDSVDEKIFDISQRKAQLGTDLLTDERSFLQEIMKETSNLIV
ncbi:hypothetical protein WA171_001778 [Blastocystis sp. BT1]